MFKKLSWIRLDTHTPFYNELSATWVQEFSDAVNSLKDIKVLSSGRSHEKEFHLNLIFMTIESHLDFIKNFYIEGLVKDLFKANMKHSTSHNIAFHMSSVLPPSWNDENKDLKLKAHVLYEICPSGQKFHASTKEHRASFDFFQWMLALPETCSVSAYYDHSHRLRHIQTLYLNYTEATHARVLEEAQKYPSFFQNRYEYNLKNHIIHQQGMREYDGTVYEHVIKESEFIENLPNYKKSFALEIF